MIYLSTEGNRDKYLSKHNSYFYSVTVPEGLDEEDKKIIHEIDGATPIDEDKIQGKFGITGIENISTGAKIILNIKNMLKTRNECYVDITSCGTNALYSLSRLLSKTKYKDKEIYLFLGYMGTYCDEPLVMQYKNKLIHSFREAK